MNLARYVAKWGWASVFILTWLVIMDWWAGPPITLFAAYLTFGGITVLSTGVYVSFLYRAKDYEKVWKYD